MWRLTIFTIFYIYLIFTANVKGSCLEYGHSCWGAHGKRSSGPAIGANNAQHGLSGAKNLRTFELNVLSDENTNQNAENKLDIDDAFASAESLLRRAISSGDSLHDMNDSTKTRSNLNLPKYASESESKSAIMRGESNRIENRAVKQAERHPPQQQHKQQEQQQSSLSLQQQRKYPQHAERWRRFPFYASRASFGNSPLALTEVAPQLAEIQPRNSDNYFLQQLGQLADERFDADGAYYEVL
ncbi:neuropeptide CCHamide-1 [Eurosta solidaginis]